MAKNKKKSHNNAPTYDNRRARHDYFIEDTLEVGIKLEGSEVKSVGDGRASIKEGFVTVDLDPPRLTLHQVEISPYPPAGHLNHTPKRNRVLLAHTREIIKLARKVEQKGITLVPLKLYFNEQGRIKLQLAIARGKAQHDKRHAIAERENQRDLQRIMSRKLP